MKEQEEGPRRHRNTWWYRRTSRKTQKNILEGIGGYSGWHRSLLRRGTYIKDIGEHWEGHRRTSKRTQEDTWLVCEDGGCSAALVARGGGGGGRGQPWHLFQSQWKGLRAVFSPNTFRTIISKKILRTWLPIFPTRTRTVCQRSSRAPWRSRCASQGSPRSGSNFFF